MAQHFCPLADRRLARVAVALLALACARPAEAKRFRVVLEPLLGVSVPLSSYVDYHGGRVEDVTLSDGSVETQDNRAQRLIRNSPHVSTGVALLLDGIEFRYVANVMGLGQSRYLIPDKYLRPYDTAARRLGKPRFAQIDARTDLTANEKAALKNQVLADITAYMADVGFEKPEKLTEIDDLAEILTFHTLGLGYRFAFLRDRPVSPYLSLTLGPVIAASPALSRSLFGFNLTVGAGFDVRVHPAVRLGLDARYHFYLTETDQELASVKYAGTKDTYEASQAMQHLLAFTGHVGIDFGAGAPAAARKKLDLRLEVSPGVGFALGRFLDGIPRYFALDYGETPWTFLETQDVTLKTDVDSARAGFNFAAAFLIEGFEFRYQLQMLGWGAARITDVAYHNVSNRIFLPAERLRALPVDVLPGVKANFGPLYLHALGFGYRFTLLEGRFEPYIPLLAGFAWAANDSFRPVYGGIAQVGLGFDVRLHERFRLGLELRYSWIAVQTPGRELYEASAKEQVAAAATSNDSGFETVLESLHLLTLGLRGQVCF